MSHPNNPHNCFGRKPHVMDFSDEEHEAGVFSDRLRKWEAWEKDAKATLEPIKEMEERPYSKLTPRELAVELMKVDHDLIEAGSEFDEMTYGELLKAVKATGDISMAVDIMGRVLHYSSLSPSLQEHLFSRYTQDDFFRSLEK